MAAVINNSTQAKLGVPSSAPFAERIRTLRGLTIGTNPIGQPTTRCCGPT